MVILVWIKLFPPFLLFILKTFKGYPGKLQQLAGLPLNAPLWVQLGKLDELAEAELRFVGPLTRGSSAVIFGVELKVNWNLGHHFLVYLIVWLPDQNLYMV